MYLFLLFPVLFGFCSVLQGGLNRRIVQYWSLPTAVLFNGLVLLSSASLFFALFYYLGDRLPESLRIKWDWGVWRPWFVLPGLMGLALVFGIPWSISQWGALKTFVVIIASQVVMSMIWDVAVEGLALSYLRMGGAVLTVLGAVLASLK